MPPLAFNAAKDRSVDVIEVKPLLLGTFTLPYDELPQHTTRPLAVRPAKAPLVDATRVSSSPPVPTAATSAPKVALPQFASIDDDDDHAANAPDVDHS